MCCYPQLKNRSWEKLIERRWCQWRGSSLKADDLLRSVGCMGPPRSELSFPILWYQWTAICGLTCISECRSPSCTRGRGRRCPWPRGRRWCRRGARPDHPPPWPPGRAGRGDWRTLWGSRTLKVFIIITTPSPAQSGQIKSSSALSWHKLD